MEYRALLYSQVSWSTEESSGLQRSSVHESVGNESTALSTQVDCTEVDAKCTMVQSCGVHKTVLECTSVNYLNTQDLK